MTDPWRTIGSLGWPVMSGTNLGLDPSPGWLLDQGIDSQRVIYPQARSMPSKTHQTQAPPQGGLLGSLNTDAAGGLLRQLAAPIRPRDAIDGSGVIPLFGHANTVAGRGPVFPNSAFLRIEDWGSKLSNGSDIATDAAPQARPRRNPLAPNLQHPPQTKEFGDDAEVLSDAAADPWIPGAQYAGQGHHHNPRAVYRKFALPEETRRVFDKATTGPLPIAGWHQYDDLHRLYSNAVEDLMVRFMQEKNIRPQQMTPEHARAFLKVIAESEEPRIRAYRAMLQHMGRLYRLRSGARGSE